MVISGNLKKKFLKYLKKEILPVNDSTIVSPVKGKIVFANMINDSMFSEEILGQTIGFIPKDREIVCPVNGVVEMLFPTGHAFGIRGNDGNGYLVHIGINTVNLNGKGFNAYIKENQKVKAGQLAIKIDLDEIKGQGYDDTVILIVSEKKKEDFNVNYLDLDFVEKGQIINHV
ncbi:PTS glucose transporter subunit IIA [Thomasclavelia sp.]|uniref:PTS glucose transporter subunit IIA n=1 Tax=Thomasclavelia sp. TaxID=3025757 RepID=UPI0025D2B76B|nr:PTS glucose transporter subunit IIA [Thomasclavelia sp.]